MYSENTNQIENSQDIFDPIEPQFDPETGEIIDVKGLLIQDLPRIARGIIATEERYEKAVANTKREIERLKAWVQTYEERRDKALAYLKERAQEMMDVTGEKKVEYPGLGKFQYVKARASVDRSIYDMLPNADRKVLLDEYPELLREKYSIEPDINKIRKALTDGNAPDCFALVDNGQEFTFRKEK